MQVYFSQVKRILDELPIGFYLGSRVPVTLDREGDTTYYDMIEKSIVISYPTIEKALQSVDDDSYAETCIRSLLYHEVSHAILTPTELMSYVKKDEERAVVNIMEDERIEETLRSYYTDVDFRKNLEIITNWDKIKNEQPENALQVFYRVVRFQTGKKKWVERAMEIVDTYGFRTLGYGIGSYYYDTIALYNEICKEYQRPDSEDNSGEGEGEGEDEEQNGNGNGEEQEIEDGKNITMRRKQMMNNAVKNLLTQAIDRANCKINDSEVNQIMGKLLPIIMSYNKKNAGGSAMGAYSGIMNPRRVDGVDYRIFDRKAAVRGVNKYCSLHLNLFLDCSGSFYNNQDAMNAVLAALSRIAKMEKNFTFDVVYCGIGEKVVTNHAELVMQCDGCNWLDKDTWDIYRRLQLPNTYNFNLVMFDGDAFTGCPSTHPWSGEVRNFGAFNHSNCVIVSDTDNQQWIEKYAPNARSIFTNNYLDELYGNIVKTLRQAFR